MPGPIEGPIMGMIIEMRRRAAHSKPAVGHDANDPAAASAEVIVFPRTGLAYLRSLSEPAESDTTRKTPDPRTV